MLQTTKTCFKDIFNQDLVDCLPGIFYFYQFVDGKAYLKAWNKNHEIAVGCASGELLNRDVFSFTDEEGLPSFKSSIETILETGFVKQVYANLKSDSGTLTPYVFEGYKIDVGEEVYFMGVGLDITDVVRAKTQIESLESKQWKKDMELLSMALKEQKHEELLHKVLLKLEHFETTFKSTSTLSEIQNLIYEIKTQLSYNDNWSVFKKLFSGVHAQFFETLLQRHPGLTKTELQYCAYLKIQMRNMEICNVMNISKEGITKKRYRLKKKLNLPKNQKLEGYIMSI